MQLEGCAGISFCVTPNQLLMHPKDCSASENQRRKVPQRGEADKAPTPTSSRPLSSSSWRVRCVMRRLPCYCLAQGLEFLSLMTAWKQLDGPSFMCVWTFLSLAPRACGLPGGLSVGMRCGAAEGLGVYDQLAARWPVARRGRYGTGFSYVGVQGSNVIRIELMDFVCVVFCSSYRPARDSVDWNHAVHCAPGCWMPPTYWKRHGQEGKRGSIPFKRLFEGFLLSHFPGFAMMTIFLER